MADFENKPIGIGNLMNLKRKARSFVAGDDAALRKVPAEKPAKLKTTGNSDEEAAQLAVDVVETGDTLYIIAPLAGIAVDEIRVEITEDVVIIEGERTYPLPEIDSDDLLVQECYFGAFSRSIVLPESVDAKRAKATFKKNVLVISLPKLDNVRTRVIRVEQ
jgi:HSP20 family protein